MSKTFMFEIGCEEIPSAALDGAASQLLKRVPEALHEARLAFKAVDVHTTPRRIIVEVKGLAETSEGLAQHFRGPSVSIAFDENGNPTKAAEGFARSKNLAVRDLVRGKEGGNEYVFATVEQIPRPVSTLMPALAENLITSIDWPRSMRWGSGEARFSRPVRWLLALYGTEVIPVSFAGLESGRTTYGHRFLAPSPIELENADQLLDALRKAYVIPDHDERAALIRSQIADAERASELIARVPKGTFSEVVNLVEYPTVLIGHFDDEFLAVPSEIITEAMLKHQRYFPMYTSDGALSSSFLIVGNGDPRCSTTIIAGNERVVRARLDDAKFFYEEDLKRPLEDYVGKLDVVVFQEKLGTTGDKVRRMVKLAGSLAEDAGLSDEQHDLCERAAKLCKADLVTNAVVEFTSQQGVMGGYYARASHEPEEVACAIEQHYRPRFAGDAVPENTVGKVVAFADKIDTICGIFAVGQAPTGSSDPFALRRAALGCISILQSGLNVSLSRAISFELDQLDFLSFDRAQVESDVRAFFSMRLTVIARDAGNDAKVVAAVLSTGHVQPDDVLARCASLSRARDEEPELFEDLATAYKRANNLRDPQLGSELDVKLLGGQEVALLDALGQAEQGVAEALEADDYDRALADLAKLRGPIDTFFTDVMIMDEDRSVRENRLRLLNRFVDVFGDVADFEKLNG